jgi:hypothetical protein
MYAARDSDDIDRFFRGLAEHAFHARLGVVDPPLVDYVAVLLVRFIRNDRMAALPGDVPEAAGSSAVGEGGIDPVARMLSIGQQSPQAAARADYRHIGDYTLFWSGLYPEALRRFRHRGRPDRLLEYREAGRRAYWIASTIGPTEAADECRLLRRLSHDFDLCVEGLAEVRRAWDEPPGLESRE